MSVQDRASLVWSPGWLNDAGAKNLLSLARFFDNPDVGQDRLAGEFCISTDSVVT
jgi:hypothetical protein